MGRHWIYKVDDTNTSMIVEDPYYDELLKSGEWSDTPASLKEKKNKRRVAKTKDSGKKIDKHSIEES